MPVLSNSTFTTANVVGPARWQAPEVFLTPDENGLPFNLQTDVFSFSMLCIEVRINFDLTGPDGPLLDIISAS